MIYRGITEKICSKYIKIEYKTVLVVSSKKDNSMCVMSSATSLLSSKCMSVKCRVASDINLTL